MKQDKLVDAIGEIKDEYIEEAHAKGEKKGFNWVMARRLAIGALCLVVAMATVPKLFSSGKKSDSRYYEGAYSANDSYAMSEESSYEPAEAESYSAATSGKTSLESVLTQNKKLIVNASLTMEAFDLDEVCDSLMAAIAANGGYIQSSSAYTRYNTRYFEATIRIPSDRFADFAGKVKESGNTTSYYEEVKDITDAYSDLEARIASLKAEEEKVMEFYDKAESIEELMSVEARLTEIRYEIDAKETQLKNYDLLTSYSTLNITITETKQYTETSEGFGTRLANAFKNGFRSFVVGLEDFLIDLSYNIWTILFLVLIGFAGYRIFKAIRKKIRNRNK